MCSWPQMWLPRCFQLSGAVVLNALCAREAAHESSGVALVWPALRKMQWLDADWPRVALATGWGRMAVLVVSARRQ